VPIVSVGRRSARLVRVDVIREFRARAGLAGPGRLVRRPGRPGGAGRPTGRPPTPVSRRPSRTAGRRGQRRLRPRRLGAQAWDPTLADRRLGRWSPGHAARAARPRHCQPAEHCQPAKQHQPAERVRRSDSSGGAAAGGPGDLTAHRGGLPTGAVGRGDVGRPGRSSIGDPPRRARGDRTRAPSHREGATSPFGGHPAGRHGPRGRRLHRALPVPPRHRPQLGGHRAGARLARGPRRPRAGTPSPRRDRLDHQCGHPRR